MIRFNSILIRFGNIHKKFGNSMIIINVLIQLSLKFIIIVDGSKILNKFIIIFSNFKCFIFFFIGFIKNKVNNI